MHTYYQSKRVINKQLAEINVVPYIDVMLVLLIIFMVAAPLLTQQGVQVELPQNPKADPIDIPDAQHRPLILTVTAAGAYQLDPADGTSTPVSLDTLLARTAAVLSTRPDTLVLVRADKNVPYGAVMEAMNLLQQAGAPSVGLLTQAPPPETRKR
jgi:biopolymer transport protein TolR